MNGRDHIWLTLLNSDWHDHTGSGRSEDRIDNEEWLNKFLAAFQPPRKEQADAAMKTRLKELRTLIRRLADDFSAGGELNEEDIESLNRILRGSPQIQIIEEYMGGYRLTAAPLTPGFDALPAEIARSFASVLAEGEPGRIKRCENPDCNWTFYDRSKNRSRKWCGGTDSCGNLLKVRRFRARKSGKNKE